MGDESMKAKVTRWSTARSFMHPAVIVEKLTGSGKNKEQAVEMRVQRALTFSAVSISQLLRDDSAASKLVFLSPEDVAKRLHTSVDVGLTSADVEKRLGRFGTNELEEPEPVPMWRRMIDQFANLLIIALLIGTIISFIAEEFVQASVILAVLVLNALLGVIQEGRSESALAALLALSSDACTVLRDGKELKVAIEDVTYGDIIILSAGDKIGADAVLIGGEGSVSEIALTGESIDINKSLPEQFDKDDHKASGEQRLSKVDVNGVSVADNFDEQELKNDIDRELSVKHTAEEMKKVVRRRMLYRGCEVTKGNLRGIVIATGMKTEIGQVQQATNEAEQGESPLKAKLDRLGQQFGIASLLASGVIFAVVVSTGRGTDPGDSSPVWLQALLIAVAVTVAAVPETLPVSVSSALAIGMQTMATKHSALVRRLEAVETLGSTTVICTDKTGTLTAGNMTARKAAVVQSSVFALRRNREDEKKTDKEFALFDITGSSYNPQDGEFQALNDLEAEVGMLPILYSSMLNSTATCNFDNNTGLWVAIGNLTERALVVAAMKGGLSSELRSKYPLVRIFDFNSARKRMTTVYKLDENLVKIFGGEPNDFIAFCKGGPSVVEPLCDMQGLSELASEIRLSYENEALRVLAFACKIIPADEYVAIKNTEDPDEAAKKVEFGMSYMGMVASEDAVRPTTAPALEECRNARIRAVMITGDSPDTAKAVAIKVGMCSKGDPKEVIIDCSEEMDLMSDAQLKKRLAVVVGFARAKPKHKIRIVEGFKSLGHVVAMTGDGVNDVPAFAAAHISVAMGDGTDAAKSKASIVLVQPSFAGIVGAAQVGRHTYTNISQFVYYLLSTNPSEVLLLLIAPIIGLPAVLKATQLLFMNFITDFMPTISMIFENPEPKLMLRGPRSKDANIIEPLMVFLCIVHNLFLTAILLGTYIIGIYWRTNAWDGSGVSDTVKSHGVDAASTMTILVVIFAEILRGFTARSMRESAFTLGLFANKYMNFSALFGIACTLFFALTPFAQPAFDMVDLEKREWGWVVGISFAPAVYDEILKMFVRSYNLYPPPTVTFNPKNGKVILESEAKTLSNAVGDNYRNGPEADEEEDDEEEVEEVVGSDE